MSSSTSPRKTIAYWLTTALVAFALAAGGLADLVGAPAVTATMTHLGYPAYVATILGVWKVLGAAAIVAPGLPRLKEWAYAGIAFDLSGAAVSHAALGDPAASVLTPVVILGLAAASWALRPASRKLASAPVRQPVRELAVEPAAA